MFLLPEELKSAIYSYQLDDITEGDDTIVIMGIEAAIQEVQSYFTPNYQQDWGDGRFLYDIEAIFSATGSERNPLILQHVKTVAVWYIIELSNVDMNYEHAKERYDRSIQWLKDLAKGIVSIQGLPTKEISITDEEGNPIETVPFRSGSRTKFNHE